MNRAQASWELIKQDRMSEPGGSNTALEYAGDVAVKAHDVLSNIFPSILTPIDQNSYEVVDRTSPISATVQRVRSTLKARWFAKGNPLNLVAKGVTALTELPDGIISDAAHLFHGGKGKVLRTAA